jgi:hypothetical protein
MKGGDHHRHRIDPGGPADHDDADREEGGDDPDADQRAVGALRPAKRGAEHHRDGGNHACQRQRPPYNAGVLRRH